VTPIGFQTYNRVFTPGPVNYVNAFNASDTTTQIGFSTKIAPVERYYVGVGYLFRGTNAPGYPSEGGLGFGIDKLPDVDRAFSLYGNFWLFFNAGGKYTAPATAALGGFSGYPFTVSYRVYTYRLGGDVQHSENAALLGPLRRRRPRGHHVGRAVGRDAQRVVLGRRVEVLGAYFPGAQSRLLAATGA